MTVPVVDISRERRRVAGEIGHACREIGFITVVGHGIDEDLVERTASAAREFFDLPDAEKRALADGEQRLGLPAYRPLRSESLAASLGRKTPGDLKESLDWGPAVAGYGWPSRPPELRGLLEEYFEGLSGLGEQLRRLFALALELPQDWFEDAFRSHSSSLRVVNYPDPQGDVEPGQLRAGAHTDYGCMTILRTEAACGAGSVAGKAADARPGNRGAYGAPGGLQVQTRAGDWLDVEARPGSFVVNLGDMMARWTNDRWQATLHRVSVPPDDRRLGSRRQTIVFFHDPRADALIDCIPGCADEANPPRYEPVTALEHVQAKAAKALA